jgi:hypothetical protein
MKQPRLAWLLAAMAGLLALRVSDWMRSDAHDDVAAAVPPPRPVISAAPRPASAALEPLVPGAQFAMDNGEPRNAFAVRQPPAPPPPPPPLPVPQPPKPFVGPPWPAPPPPAPPPPPLQVIGTWQDAQGLSVFIAGPGHTAQARAGDTVFAQYRLARVTPAQIVIHEIATNRDFSIPVPQVDPRTNPLNLP